MEMDPRKCLWMKCLGKPVEKKKEKPDRRSSQQVSNPAAGLIKQKLLIKRKFLLCNLKLTTIILTILTRPKNLYCVSFM